MATYTVEINFLSHAEQDRYSTTATVSRHRAKGINDALARALARLYGKRAWLKDSQAFPPLYGRGFATVYGTAYKPVGGNASTAVSGNLRIDIRRK